jgi:ankyrin repeat protein
MAADHQRLPVIDALAAAATPLDEADPIWGRHPLRLAAANGRADSVRQLLDLGADPTRTDAEGRTPLHLATAAGHRQVQDLLASWI